MNNNNLKMKLCWNKNLKKYILEASLIKKGCIMTVNRKQLHLNMKELNTQEVVFGNGLLVKLLMEHY